MIKKIYTFFAIFFITLFFIQNIFASEKKSSSSITLFLTITSNEVKLKTEPSQGAPDIKVNFSLFGKSFELKDRYGNWNKIDMGNGQEGWINNSKTQLLSNTKDSNYVMAMKEPLKKESSQKESSQKESSQKESSQKESSQKESSQIYKKALIINPLKQEISNLSTQIKYYSSPQLTGDPKGQISIFEVRYLFNEDKKHYSYLLGRTDRLKKENSQSVLIGWIDAKHVMFWNNKIGIEFDKTNYRRRLSSCGLGKIYYPERYLLYNHKEPVYYEDKSEDFMAYYVNRFPLLDKLNYKNKKYYKIAYIGNAFNGGKIYTPQEIDEAKHQISLAADDKVQIAILIDATKGMRKHIGIVKNALREFLQEELLSKEKSTKKTTKLNSNVAIAIYRDYPDGRERMYEKKSDFTQDYSKLQKALDSISVIEQFKDRGIGTYPEALFYGISETIHNLSWKNIEQGEKYILLIGDHGNHEDYSQYPQDKIFSAEKIGQHLKEKLISLFAVQVNISDDKIKYNKMFERQLRTIIENNHKFGRLTFVHENSTQAILKKLKEITHFHEEIVNTLNIIRSSKNLAKMYKGQITNTLFERYNIDPKIFQASQICDVGYVYKSECNQNQIVERVLMDKRYVQKLRTQVSSLSESIKYFDPENEDAFKLTIYSVVKALTGDKLEPGQNIKNFIEKKAGIPVRTKMLDKSLEDLLTEVRSNSKRRDYRKELEEKILRLTEIMNEQEVIFGDWDQDKEIFHYTTGKKKNYFFSLEIPLPKRPETKLDEWQKTHAWMPLDAMP